MVVDKYDDIEPLVSNVVITMAVELEQDEVIQTVVATLANIEECKPEQEECVILFIEGKDIVALLPTGSGTRLIY